MIPTRLRSLASYGGRVSAEALCAKAEKWTPVFGKNPAQT